MPEYIDREAFKSKYLCCGYLPEMSEEEFDSFPAADVAPVVHCKGCEHAERYERTDGTVGYYCGHPQNTFAYGERWDRVFKPVKEADDFCSYGKRKDAPCTTQ